MFAGIGLKALGITMVILMVNYLTQIISINGTVVKDLTGEFGLLMFIFSVSGIKWLVTTYIVSFVLALIMVLDNYRGTGR